jgi:hypothetical protein
MHLKAKKSKEHGEDSFKLGDKEFPVKEAQELIAMMRVAGLDTHKLEEALAIQVATIATDQKVSVDEPKSEPVNNAHRKEIKTMRQSTMGPGEGDAGEKRMYGMTPPGDNPMSDKPSVIKVKPVAENVIKLEADLAKEYESIKKVN